MIRMQGEYIMLDAESQRRSGFVLHDMRNGKVLQICVVFDTLVSGNDLLLIFSPMCAC